MGRKTTGEKLEREAVKSYLQQYHTARQKKRILEERHRTLSAELRGPSTSPAYKATPSSRPVHPDGAGTVVFKIAEVEERIEAQQAEMAKAVQNVTEIWNSRISSACASWPIRIQRDEGGVTMTRDQQLAALVAIRVRQNAIRESLSGDPSQELVQRADKVLEDLEGAYAAINAIKTEG